MSDHNRDSSTSAERALRTSIQGRISACVRRSGRGCGKGCFGNRRHRVRGVVRGRKLPASRSHPARASRGTTRRFVVKFTISLAPDLDSVCGGSERESGGMVRSGARHSRSTRTARWQDDRSVSVAAGHRRPLPIQRRAGRLGDGGLFGERSGRTGMGFTDFKIKLSGDLDRDRAKIALLRDGTERRREFGGTEQSLGASRRRDPFPAGPRLSVLRRRGADSPESMRSSRGLQTHSIVGSFWTRASSVSASSPSSATYAKQRG